jgi:hypothetical protein
MVVLLQRGGPAPAALLVRRRRRREVAAASTHLWLVRPRGGRTALAALPRPLFSLLILAQTNGRRVGPAPRRRWRSPATPLDPEEYGRHAILQCSCRDAAAGLKTGKASWPDFAGPRVGGLTGGSYVIRGHVSLRLRPGGR